MPMPDPEKELLVHHFSVSRPRQGLQNPQSNIEAEIITDIGLRYIRGI